MGGIGSGRHWRWDARDLTTDYLSFDARRWAREGFLEAGRRFSWSWFRDGERCGRIDVVAREGSVVLTYRHRSFGGEWEDLCYPVQVLKQPMHFGGHRSWFACPVNGCGRRSAILYGGRVFACRTCHQLAYPSQREKPYERAQRRAENLRMKLGWDPRDDWGEKPKGMHHRTFARLAREIVVHEHAYDQGFVEYFVPRMLRRGER